MPTDIQIGTIEFDFIFVLSDDRLRGDLVVTLNPDGWVPKPSRCIPLTFHLDIPVNAGTIEGTYACTGENDETFNGRVVGSMVTPLKGRFKTSGFDGAWQGLVSGSVRPAATDPKRLCLQDETSKATDPVQQAQVLFSWLFFSRGSFSRGFATTFPMNAG